MSWFQKIWSRREQSASTLSEISAAATPTTRASTEEVDIPPTDPLLAYILNTPGIIEVDKLNLDSPTLRRLKETNIRLAVPLISQGELIGLLNLGTRLSEADYSTDDRRLLNTLATQAAPALRVAQLARQQQIEARERERMEQELRVARVIQQTLLPKEIPSIPGWRMAAHWQPARAVSGDFYDFITFPDGKIAIIVGDVTDKGVPAALVMATTRSILRSAVEHLVSPGKVLERANNQLCPDIPPNMFVTCLYTLLDPATGIIRYANAGHNVAYQRSRVGVQEMRARGMPLGLMPDMEYEEKETFIGPGDMVVLYSDGLVEAHNPIGEMFGFPRLRDLLVTPECGEGLIACVLDELQAFTGPTWEQEDDVTFVTLDRFPETADQQTLAEFAVPSLPGNERLAIERVLDAVKDLELSRGRLDRLKTAVAEATMNAMEHGNKYRDNLMVEIKVMASDEALSVFIRDHGGDKEIPKSVAPDLEAKLAGLQSPRGWGLFLINKMVDEMHVSSDQEHHTVELVMKRRGETE
jgi:serine phosphatase RsbU (regulator of sigma subunit)/anti-sigma regulatory factor (Ser/Thr protein kinase)